MKLTLSVEPKEFTFTPFTFDRISNPDYYKESVFGRTDIGMVHINFRGKYLGNSWIEVVPTNRVEISTNEDVAFDADAIKFIKEKAWEAFVNHAGQSFIDDHIQFFNKILKGK